MVTLHELSFLPLRVTDLQSAGRGNSQNGNSTRTLNTVFQTSLSVKCCYQKVAGYVSSDIVQVSAIYP